MSSVFPVPPTYADPMETDPVTGKPRFNPIWLNYFLQIALYFTNLNTTVSGGNITADTFFANQALRQNGAQLNIEDSGGNSVVAVAATNKLGFYGTAPIAQPTVTGAKGGNAALTNLLTTLAAQGLLIDSTT